MLESHIHTEIRDVFTVIARHHISRHRLIDFYQYLIQLK